MMTETSTLRLVFPLNQLPAFNPLLQQGVWLRVETGCSVMGLLVDQLGIDRAYVTERITTLFLDGKAIDDLETAYVRAGATLALSSAMPGLVGTTMRRGGHLAAMRNGITYRGRQPEQVEAGRVRIKLFNMVMVELGAILLLQGIWLTAGELTDFLAGQRQSFRQTCRLAQGDEPGTAPLLLEEHLRRQDAQAEMQLRVEFSD